MLDKKHKEEAEKRGLIITSAPLIGYSVTQPAPELVNLVNDMGWDNKLKLYRNPKRKSYPDKTKTAKKKSSTRKYICPKCGLSVRATKVVRIACMDCGNIQLKEVIV